MTSEILEFFLGVPPVGYEGIFYTFSCLIGVMLFDMILDIFRFLRKTIMPK